MHYFRFIRYFYVDGMRVLCYYRDKWRYVTSIVWRNKLAFSFQCRRPKGASSNWPVFHSKLYPATSKGNETATELQMKSAEKGCFRKLKQASYVLKYSSKSLMTNDRSSCSCPPAACTAPQPICPSGLVVLSLHSSVSAGQDRGRAARVR